LSASAERVPASVGRLRRAWTSLADAVTFLTIVPLPAVALASDELDLTHTVVWFPLVGAAIGAFAGALRLLCQPLFGGGPSTAVAMIGLVLICGALHQDALADSADGLGVRGDRTRRLAVMRDSSSGAFGVLALIAWALLLFSSLTSLRSEQALRALIAACAAGRLAALVHASLAPPAGSEGLGAGLHVKHGALAIAGAIGAAIMFAAAGPVRGAVSLGVCGLVSALSAALAWRVIGGSTGDTIGATVAVCEVAVCLALLSTWR